MYSEETEESPPRNYATVSLFCLSVTNPLRKNAIQLVSDVWFDRVVNSVIIINCLYIAMEGEDFDFIKYTANVDAMFLAFYSFVFLIQIIALGFVARQYTYLRDCFNFIDFIALIAGWILNVLMPKNISILGAVRTMKLIKVFRDINSTKSFTILSSAIGSNVWNYIFMLVSVLIMGGILLS